MISPASDAEDGFGCDEDRALDCEKDKAALRTFSQTSCNERRNSISAAPVSEARIKDWKGPPVHAKSDEETARIKDAIDRSEALQVLFGHLAGNDLMGIIGAMFSRRIEVDEVVISQGSDGDFFYIVDSGTYDIFVRRKVETPPEKVMVATCGMSFGELALMYNVPRAATVKCAEAGTLWCLDREVFQMMIVTAENTKKTEFESFLTDHEMFSDFTTYELSKISDCLTSELFDGDEDIVKQGDQEKAVYFLYEGECKAYIDGPEGEIEVKHYTQPGECFGEIAAFTDEPRRATVRACGDGCIVLCLKMEDVTVTIGPLESRALANIPKYEAIGSTDG